MGMAGGLILAGVLSVALVWAETPAPAGRWDGEVTIQGLKIPFALHFDGTGETYAAALVVGERRIGSTAASFDGQRLRVVFGEPASRWEAELRDGQLKGMAEGEGTRHPFQASAFCTCGFVGEAGPDVSGSWVGDHGTRVTIRRVGEDTIATLTRAGSEAGPFLGRYNGAFFELSFFDGVRGAVLELEQRKGGLEATLAEPGVGKRKWLAVAGKP